MLGIDSAALLDVDTDDEVAFAQAPRFSGTPEIEELAESDPETVEQKEPMP